MKIICEYDDGPMKGTVEVDNLDFGFPPPGANPSQTLLWMMFTLSGGEVGKGSGGATPASYALLQMGDHAAIKNLEPRAKRMAYTITAKEEKNGTIHLKAKYDPVDGKYTPDK